MKVCWYCNAENEQIPDDFLGDFDCEVCHIMNSCYNLEDGMKPPVKSSKDYEKVKVGDFVFGVIDKIEYDQEHKFKGYQGKEDSVQPAVRLKFKLDGYAYPHYSRWMKFLYSEKANLYVKYLVPLVQGAVPDMDLDLDVLVGLRVKTLWEEKNDFQSVALIWPEGEKVVPGVGGTKSADDDVIEEEHQDES